MSLMVYIIILISVFMLILAVLQFWYLFLFFILLFIPANRQPKLTNLSGNTHNELDKSFVINKSIIDVFALFFIFSIVLISPNYSQIIVFFLINLAASMYYPPNMSLYLI